jgi:hypothetical protein
MLARRARGRAGFSRPPPAAVDLPPLPPARRPRAWLPLRCFARLCACVSARFAVCVFAPLPLSPFLPFSLSLSPSWPQQAASLAPQICCLHARKGRWQVCSPHPNPASSCRANYQLQKPSLLFLHSFKRRGPVQFALPSYYHSFSQTIIQTDYRPSTIQGACNRITDHFGACKTRLGPRQLSATRAARRVCGAFVVACARSPVCVFCFAFSCNGSLGRAAREPSLRQPTQLRVTHSVRLVILRPRPPGRAAAAHAAAVCTIIRSLFMRMQRPPPLSSLLFFHFNTFFPWACAARAAPAPTPPAPHPPNNLNNVCFWPP